MSDLKRKVKEYWNGGACGSDDARAEKYSRPYFEQIEEARYRGQPEIFSFAQFTRYRGKKVLEVGVGAGTDFIQWVRAGALAYGVDLTEEAVEHARRRLAIEGLEAGDVRVADAEALPYSDETFDLAYSWGVIHHSPDMEQALRELVRVTRVGGDIKIMVYNRRSVYAFFKYLQLSLLQGRPFRSVARTLADGVESPGTKACTFGEMKAMLSRLPVEITDMSARAVRADFLWKKSFVHRLASYVLIGFSGFNRAGWNMTVTLKKTGPLDDV